MKLIKRLVYVVVALLVLLIGGVFFVALRIDSIARSAAETGTEYALGVDTRVGGVDVSLFGGTIGMSDFVVGNPEGFETQFLLSNRDLNVQVETSSLFGGEEIVVPVIELAGLTVNIEQKGGSTNIDKITEHLKTITGGGGDEAEQEEASEGVKLRVGRIVIRDLEANVQVLPIGGQLTTFKVPIPELVFENVTPDNAQGVVVSELMEQLFPAIMAAIVNKAGELGEVPIELLAGISEDVLSIAGDLGGAAGNLLNQVGGDIGKQLQNVLGETGGDVGRALDESVGDTLRNVGEGLNNLLGGDK